MPILKTEIEFELGCSNCGDLLEGTVDRNGNVMVDLCGRCMEKAKGEGYQEAEKEMAKQSSSLSWKEATA
jgi:cytochrome c2